MLSLQTPTSGSSFRYVLFTLSKNLLSLKRLYQTFKESLLGFLKGKRIPLSVDQQRALNENGRVQTMFEYYESAGEKAGIPASDVGRQFEAEYVILPSKRRLFLDSLLPYLDMVSTHFAGV